MRFLGVDGGQSGTTVVAGDETGRIVGRGVGPPCRLAGAIAHAVRAAGFDGEQFDAACFGLSGGQPQTEAQAREAVQANRYVFLHDAAVALTGALAGGPGVIVIAGTGSIAFGRNAAGEEARAGGWGYVFGDEGGGFDLVRGAVRAALRQEEGWGALTALRDLLLDATGSASANQMLHRFYTAEFPREKVAGYAPLIQQAAEAGDAVAQELLRSAAQALATIASVVRRRLFHEGESVAISGSGGLFQNPMLQARFQMLVELEEGNRFTTPLHSPAEGALIETYRAAGLTCTLKQ